MDYEFIVDGELNNISFDKKGDIFIVSIGEETFEADIKEITPNTISILIDGKSYLVYCAQDRDKKYLYLNGKEYFIQEPSEINESFQAGEEKDQEGKLIVKAPMPGKVIKINVSEKDEVRKNQTLAIVEAMKMENEIKSYMEGIVKTIFVSPGDLVDSEKPLIELEPKK